MPRAPPDGDKLDEFAISPDKKVRRDAQVPDALEVRMCRRIQAIGKEPLDRVAAVHTWRQADRVHHQQADGLARRALVAIR
jgi:hypothetical protein